MSDVDTLVCWKCGASIGDLPLPLGRRAECTACRADLHVCRMCEFYDTRVARSCREPVAEEVGDKERSNFCGYFKARPGAHAPLQTAETDAAKARLEDMFGVRPPDTPAEEAARRGAATESDVAREKLEQLFGLGGKKG